MSSYANILHKSLSNACLKFILALSLPGVLFSQWEYIYSLQWELSQSSKMKKQVAVPA